MLTGEMEEALKRPNQGTVEWKESTSRKKKNESNLAEPNSIHKVLEVQREQQWVLLGVSN